MRFTIIDTKKRAPSFSAKYNRYIFLLLSSAQIISIAFAFLLVWTFMNLTNPILLATGALIYLAAAFYFSYKSPVFSQLVILLSIIGLECVYYFSLPANSLVPILNTKPDNLIILFSAIDLALLFFFFYLSIMFPEYRRD
ncbi:MAG: hypothetical protein WC492_04670 [Candidatus Micrarchaeia archaeon]